MRRGGGGRAAHDPVAVVERAVVPLHLTLQLEQVDAQQRVLGVDEGGADEPVGLGGAAGGEARAGGLEQAQRAGVRVDGQLGGTGPGGGGGLVAAPTTGAARGVVECRHHVVVGSVRRRGEMPRAPVVLRGAGERVGESAVDLATS